MNKIEKIEGIPLVTIPAGGFMMGHVYRHDPALPENVNKYYPDEQPVHRVKLKAFQLGETPVTQGQYRKIMENNPSRFTGDDNLPVTNMGADNVEKFCNKLSETVGLDPCYDEKTRECDFSGNGFRLPTEEEWEYACRAGTTTHFYSGNTEKDLEKAGWYITNSGGITHPVALKEPNAWGLYDMHGNVFEFCNDNWVPGMCYGRYLTDGEADPVYHYYFDLRVTRGGDWFSEPSVCRSAARSCFCNWAGLKQSYHTGFRIARGLK
ncbi:MAG: formylglycine-generating enzyme family protein [Candidatus Latescibacteria bacterium]|jgi:formylglycine-generating enzyme|nr:formylglycine-generating enzyme family protein [Candidatus Latescibacterota bacterium]